MWLIICFCFQGGYPAKLKKVLIVTAPLWFKAPFKILRLFVREKLRERVYTVSLAQLSSHIPRASLPTTLGGVLDLDHDAWLARCLASMNTRNDDAVETPAAEIADPGKNVKFSRGAASMRAPLSFSKNWAKLSLWIMRFMISATLPQP